MLLIKNEIPLPNKAVLQNNFVIIHFRSLKKNIMKYCYKNCYDQKLIGFQNESFRRLSVSSFLFASFL